MVMHSNIRDLYPGVIQSIMAENGIVPVNNPSPLVAANTGFAQALQHTDWYTYRGDTRPPYRYRRYLEALNYVSASDRREAHVDIGCGAGLFSWAFLDWAKEQRLGYDHVDLYGLDHNQEMIRLARMVRDRLAQGITDYPDLHYYNDVDALLLNLTENHQANTDYTITFGHVLVQANTPYNMQIFAQIIAYIINLMNPESNCALWAIDARGRSAEFTTAWSSLLNNLSQTDVHYKEHNFPVTAINDSTSAKVAFLNRA